MKNLPEVTYRSLSQNTTFTAQLTDGVCTITTSVAKQQARVKEDNHQLFLEFTAEEHPVLSLFMKEFLFGHLKEIQSINRMGRRDFFQIPLLWHSHAKYQNIPATMIKTGEVSHPLRPPFHAGEVLYKRYIPQLQKTIRFRVVDAEKDLDTFHDWHNQDRVAEFWELKKPKAELLDYLKKGLEDSHQMPMFVEFDREPVGYFEMYWTKEDRLGPYYEPDNYDRGFHFLIGNQNHLGFDKTDAILKSVCHFLFLDEERTQRIMAEPRSDNKRVLRYLEGFHAWRKVKEFDFPHKHAALLECDRQKFFEENYL